MKTTKEILLENIPKDCWWEEMENLTNTPVEYVTKAMESFAAQSVREDRESRWISVNDLFPKEKVDVLGMVKMWKLGKEVKVMSVVRYNELGFWENLSYTDMEVTHWQPLPSPPTKVVFE